MNATPHTAIALGIHLALPNNPILAYGISITSHWIADHINESGLSEKEQVNFDVLPLTVAYVIAGFTGNLELLFRANTSGNMLDIIDKKGYGNKLYPYIKKVLPNLANKIESNEKGKKFIKWWITPTRYFHKQKILFNPNPWITKYIFGLGLGIYIIKTLLVM